MAALFPPSSSNDLPSLAATSGAKSLPIFVLPVAEINGIFASLHRAIASSLPPFNICTRFL